MSPYLWPAVRMELGQKRWLKQLVAQVVAKTASIEALTWPVANRRSQFQKCGCIPGSKLLPPWAGSKQLTYWTSETALWCEKCKGSTGLPPPQLRVWVLWDLSGILHKSVACSEMGTGTRRVAKATSG